MASFRKAGKVRINLDRVQWVDERELPSPAGQPGTVPGVHVHFGPSAGDVLNLTGDDAAAFLDAVDGKPAAVTKTPAAPTPPVATK